jgi:hypothetical protein
VHGRTNAGKPDLSVFVTVPGPLHCKVKACPSQPFFLLGLTRWLSGSFMDRNSLPPGPPDPALRDCCSDPKSVSSKLAFTEVLDSS